MRLFMIACILMGVSSIVLPLLAGVAILGIILFLMFRFIKPLNEIWGAFKEGASGRSAQQGDQPFQRRDTTKPNPQVGPKTAGNRKQTQQGPTAQRTVYERPYPGAAEPEPKPVKSRILPKASGKRLKIVQNFNKKYELFLTDEQMQRMVDSSYMSETWKREVEAMSAKYESVFQWFQGDTKYLRAYIHAFRVQEISSDIRLQEQICLQAFEQVWSYADTLTNLTLEERIARVNETYYAKFDNITFMIAYRYLEAHGKSHKLDTMDLIQEEDELEKLKRKYDDGTMPM